MQTNQQIQTIIDAIGKKILDKNEQIKLILAALLSGGHVLLEDRPGLGKTTLATAIAQVFGLDYKRVQMTSDMMPGDLLGVSIYHPEKQQFSYHQGPIFTQFLLADELNRTTAKTQSALLEAMAERQVSMDGKTYPLDEIFFVMATQNPIDESGTYQLPHSQLDRFIISLSLGYPAPESERQLYSSQYLETFEQALTALSSAAQLQTWQRQVQAIHAADEVLDLLQNLVTKTRNNKDLRHGLSPRAGLALFRLSQALAFINNRDFIIPEDLQQAFYPICRHRLETSQSSLSVKQVVEQILDNSRQL